MTRAVEFTNRAFAIFIVLQALDMITTILGLHLGAKEGAFISRLMQFGPVRGLLISKAISLILVSAVVAFGKGRLMRFLNPWYTAIVTWNLIVIFKLK
jgi:hypothetical protein